MSRPPVPPPPKPPTKRRGSPRTHLARVALAYTSDSRWRNRAEFIQGRAETEAFLARKWARELDYRLIKEVWAFRENPIAPRFAMNGVTMTAIGSEAMATKT
jgi:uncharacterized protein